MVRAVRSMASSALTTPCTLSRSHSTLSARAFWVANQLMVAVIADNTTSKATQPVADMRAAMDLPQAWEFFMAGVSIRSREPLTHVLIMIL
ncbi:hypothetical protein D3C78_860290 [compost metagenome]